MLESGGEVRDTGLSGLFLPLFSLKFLLCQGPRTRTDFSSNSSPTYMQTDVVKASWFVVQAIWFVGYSRVNWGYLRSL